MAPKQDPKPKFQEGECGGPGGDDGRGLGVAVWGREGPEAGVKAEVGR